MFEFFQKKETPPVKQEEQSTSLSASLTKSEIHALAEARKITFPNFNPYYLEDNQLDEPSKRVELYLERFIFDLHRPEYFAECYKLHNKLADFLKEDLIAKLDLAQFRNWEERLPIREFIAKVAELQSRLGAFYLHFESNPQKAFPFLERASDCLKGNFYLKLNLAYCLQQLKIANSSTTINDVIWHFNTTNIEDSSEVGAFAYYLQGRVYEESRTESNSISEDEERFAEQKRNFVAIGEYQNAYDLYCQHQVHTQMPFVVLARLALLSAKTGQQQIALEHCEQLELYWQNNSDANLFAAIFYNIYSEILTLIYPNNLSKALSMAIKALNIAKCAPGTMMVQLTKNLGVEIKRLSEITQTELSASIQGEKSPREYNPWGGQLFSNPSISSGNESENSLNDESQDFTPGFVDCIDTASDTDSTDSELEDISECNLTDSPLQRSRGP